MSTGRYPDCGPCCPGAAHGISSAAGVAAYTVSRSTEHAPLVQCLRHLTGDIRLLFPIPTWSSPCYTTECEALWAGDSKSQNKAWADLRSWIPNVLAAAVRPARYIQLIGFAVMATGEMQCCWESNEHCSLYHTLCLVAQLCLVRPWSDIM